MYRNEDLYAVFLNDVKKVYVSNKGPKTNAQADERIRAKNEW